MILALCGVATSFATASFGEVIETFSSFEIWNGEVRVTFTSFGPLAIVGAGLAFALSFSFGALDVAF